MQKLTVVKLRELLKEKGISPSSFNKTTKPYLIKYASKARCDPYKDEFCSEDEICDISNKVCIDYDDRQEVFKPETLLKKYKKKYRLAGDEPTIKAFTSFIKDKRKNKVIEAEAEDEEEEEQEEEEEEEESEEDLKKLTVKKLKDLLKQRSITAGYKRMNKPDLIKYATSPKCSPDKKVSCKCDDVVCDIRNNI